jgi:hypothetical protein
MKSAGKLANPPVRRDPAGVVCKLCRGRSRGCGVRRRSGVLRRRVFVGCGQSNSNAVLLIDSCEFSRQGASGKGDIRTRGRQRYRRRPASCSWRGPKPYDFPGAVSLHQLRATAEAYAEFCLDRKRFLALLKEQYHWSRTSLRLSSCPTVFAPPCLARSNRRLLPAAGHCDHERPQLKAATLDGRGCLSGKIFAKSRLNH